MNKKVKHGGFRKGSGRKPYLKPSEKKIKTSIIMNPEHHKLTAGNRSSIIEKALDKYLLRNISKFN